MTCQECGRRAGGDDLSQNRFGKLGDEGVFAAGGLVRLTGI